MMRTLTLVHRWLGVPFCLLFAMWFASGIVMHFVPFPALGEAERFAGLAPIDIARVRKGPREAVAASDIGDAARVRLMQRSEGPVYVVSDAARTVALYANDLSPATLRSGIQPLAIALDYARRRDLAASGAADATPVAYDQWTVAGDLDRHRPLWRVALHDAAGTEVYVSSATGEIVQASARRARRWNYAGSIAHWIYPTALRSRPGVWTATVWVVSLAASVAAFAGAALGMLRSVPRRKGLPTPYEGWHALHHLLGLACGTFVLGWMVSGWLSIDDGLLFSSGRLNDREAAVVAASSWTALPPGPPRELSAQAREVEWFFFDGRPYRRDRTDVATQLLYGENLAGEASTPRAFLSLFEVEGLARRLAPACTAVRIDTADAYATAPSIPGAPMYRIACGELWFQVDGASGAIVDRLDSSRRTYRRLFGALHRLEIPYLAARPAMRGALIVILCGCGLAFSLTGCVIAWRRARLWTRRDRPAARG